MVFRAASSRGASDASWGAGTGVQRVPNARLSCAYLATPRRVSFARPRALLRHPTFVRAADRLGLGLRWNPFRLGLDGDRNAVRTRLLLYRHSDGQHPVLE